MQQALTYLLELVVWLFVAAFVFDFTAAVFACVERTYIASRVTYLRQLPEQIQPLGT